MTAKVDLTVLGLGDMEVTRDPSVTLVCLGLGSCVAVCVYDPMAKVGGMAHIVLPQSNGREDTSSAKYVDTGVPRLLAEMTKRGASLSRLIVKIVGGAQMSSAPGLNSIFNIGEKNLEATKSILAAHGISVAAADTGGSRGRTARLSVATGNLAVTRAGGIAKEL